ncbi:hypothetical protein OFK41_07805 [Acinetobacter baumannii]|uniref:hypothetical protein n=1 Tax=Acinetobacter baumannii TaxID=470 RepID=UPI00124ACF01|nr:hypothetical protein [Acinetobacter baumannii]MCX3034111.1 hypothetical protein [Acinetobacter baumannii]
MSLFSQSNQKSTMLLGKPSAGKSSILSLNFGKACVDQLSKIYSDNPESANLKCIGFFQKK